MSSRIHLIHGIIPPYMLQRIAEQGSPLQRERAQNALALSATLRAQRQALEPPHAFPAPSLGATRTVYGADQGDKLPGRQVRSEGGPARETPP